MSVRARRAGRNVERVTMARAYPILAFAVCCVLSILTSGAAADAVKPYPVPEWLGHDFLSGFQPSGTDKDLKNARDWGMTVLGGPVLPWWYDGVGFYDWKDGKKVYTGPTIPRRGVRRIQDAGFKATGGVAPMWESEILAQHPDWQWLITPDAKPVAEVAKSYPYPFGCWYGPFGDWYIHKNVLMAQQLGWDGQGLDGFGGTFTACYCKYCREGYKKATGHDIPKLKAYPAPPDVSDPEYRRYIKWRMAEYRQVRRQMDGGSEEDQVGLRLHSLEHQPRPLVALDLRPARRAQRDGKPHRRCADGRAVLGLSTGPGKQPASQFHQPPLPRRHAREPSDHVHLLPLAGPAERRPSTRGERLPYLHRDRQRLPPISDPVRSGQRHEPRPLCRAGQGPPALDGRRQVRQVGGHAGLAEQPAVLRHLRHAWRAQGRGHRQRGRYSRQLQTACKPAPHARAHGVCRRHVPGRA